MYAAILSDYYQGLKDSCRVQLFLREVYQDEKLVKLVSKIFKYNFFLHFFPSLLASLCYYIFGINLYGVLDLINYPIYLFSFFFHLLHYLDLINIICKNKSKNNGSIPILEVLSLAITMAFYQIVIYITTLLIHFVLHDRLYLVSISLNFIILTIYHSFYCYNNFWQYKKIDLKNRIDICEKLWPYYYGYGTLATLIYLYTDHSFILGIYNLYLVSILSMPFIIKARYPSRSRNYPIYPPINLSAFSYLTNFIFRMSRSIIDFIASSN